MGDTLMDVDAPLEVCEVQGEKFAADCRAELEKQLKEWGSPQRYLEYRLGCPSAGGMGKWTKNVRDFMQWLWDTFPEKDSALYCYAEQLPATKHADLSTTLPLGAACLSLGL